MSLSRVLEVISALGDTVDGGDQVVERINSLGEQVNRLTDCFKALEPVLSGLNDVFDPTVTRTVALELIVAAILKSGDRAVLKAVSAEVRSLFKRGQPLYGRADVRRAVTEILEFSADGDAPSTKRRSGQRDRAGAARRRV